MRRTRRRPLRQAPGLADRRAGLRRHARRAVHARARAARSTGWPPRCRWAPSCSTSSSTRWCSSGAPPQNIVWGGIAGCMPVLIGWAGVTGAARPGRPLVLFGVVFFWTPPHTWTLAMRYQEDYAAAEVPMLPVVATERRVDPGGRSSTPGPPCCARWLLWPVAHTTLFYPVAAAVLGAVCLWEVHRLLGPRQRRQDRRRPAPDALLPLVQRLPGAAVPRRRHRPAAELSPPPVAVGFVLSLW